MLTLKIITINTWKGEDAYDVRIENLKQQLLALQPDIILMQECFEAPLLEKDTISYINQAFNYHLDFVQAREKIRDFEEFPVQSFSNMAILSRLPILNSFHYPLPLADGDEMRFGQEVEFFLENGKTAILTNIHLTHLNQNSNIRLEQIKKVTERIQHQKNILHIIGGDFNATINSTEIQYLIQEANLIESFSYIQPKEKHHTLVDYLHKNNDLGVDFIFISKEQKQYKITQANICLNEPILTSYGYCSDHFGMLLNIEYA
jgi:endonuclease/exonuclease/phosphatase family metal-dependent hydrolase